MTSIRVFFVGVASLFLVSCSSTLKPTGFLGKDDAKMTANKEIPFSRSWKNPKAKLSDYSLVAIKPIQTSRLRALDSMASVNVRNIGKTYAEDVAELAEFGTQNFGKELGSSPNRRALITKSPGRKKGQMILETNLAEMEPGRPSMQVVNLLIPFVSLLNRPSVGLEGRFVDASTGETLFAFSDLERAELSLLDLQSFTYYGVQERELELWAKQLRKVVDSNASTLVRDPFFIQPINW